MEVSEHAIAVAGEFPHGREDGAAILVAENGIQVDRRRDQQVVGLTKALRDRILQGRARAPRPDRMRDLSQIHLKELIQCIQPAHPARAADLDFARVGIKDGYGAESHLRRGSGRQGTIGETRLHAHSGTVGSIVVQHLDVRVGPPGFHACGLKPVQIVLDHRDRGGAGSAIVQVDRHEKTVAFGAEVHFAPDNYFGLEGLDTEHAAVRCALIAFGWRKRGVNAMHAGCKSGDRILEFVIEPRAAANGGRLDGGVHEIAIDIEVHIADGGPFQPRMPGTAVKRPTASQIHHPCYLFSGQHPQQ